MPPTNPPSTSSKAAPPPPPQVQTSRSAMTTPTTGRTSKKRVNHQEEEESQEEGGSGGSQESAIGSEDEEGENSDEDQDGNEFGKLNWQKIITREANKGSKPDRATSKKLKDEMESILNNALEESQTLIDQRSTRLNETLEKLGLSQPKEGEAQKVQKYQGRIAPGIFEHHIQLQRQRTQGLVKQIEEYLTTTQKENQGFVDQSRKQLENSIESAEQTKKTLEGIKEQILRERSKMCNRHLIAGENEFSDVKHAASAKKT